MVVQEKDWDSAGGREFWALVGGTDGAKVLMVRMVMVMVMDFGLLQMAQEE